MASPLDSTYGVWLVSLFLETLLYGMGLLQTWLYFAGRPTDLASVKWTVGNSSFTKGFRATDGTTGPCRLVRPFKLWSTCI